MTNTITIGDTIQTQDNIECTYNFAFKPHDVLKQWNLAGALADAAADYYRYTFSGVINHQIISTVLNELIENAAKFAKDKQSTISIITIKSADRLYITISNEVNQDRWEMFMQVSNELFTVNLDNLFKNRIFNLRDNTSSPGLGLILLKKNYHTDLSFSFVNNNDDCFNVSVTAGVPLS